ncbi:MAG TPA: aconitate hydratase, partial [Chitinophagales bacterium]|nr:aconitate hydratase [Chitinophagales bacterium]
IWPTQEEINEVVDASVTREDFEETYKVIFDGDEQWQALDAPNDPDFKWEKESDYVREVPFFQDISLEPAEVKDIKGARVLLSLGDSITTDHISPAGSFTSKSAAGQYLIERGVKPYDFNSYGSRRGNHEVMMRGTFANVRIKNKITDKEGGYSKHIPSGETDFVYNVAMRYAEENTPLVILAGKEYGSGSSRDWAAKGTVLLGVRAVIAESYERIHRSNLVQMGVAPLVFTDGQNADSLGLDGTEEYSISGLAEGLVPHKILDVKAVHSSGKETNFKVLARLDAPIEIEYYKNGGILQYVLRDFLKEA